MKTLLRTTAGSLLLCVGGAHAQSALLVDASLRFERIDSPRLFAHAMAYTDATGERVSRPIGEVLALLIEPSTSRPLPQLSIGEEPIGRLRTTDGQVLFGRLVSSEAAEQITWETMLLDRLSLSLEDVLEIVSDISLPHGASVSTDDLIELRNGDELTGFVEAVRPSVVIETAAGVRSFEPVLVRRVALANPATLASDPLVALNDGSVLVSRSLSTDDSGTITLIAGSMDASVSIRERDLLGVLFDPKRVIGLHTLGQPSHEPADGQRWIDPPRMQTTHPLGVGDIEFAGPTIARWALPEGSQRFSTVVELPADAGVWGSCSVVITLEGISTSTELARINLDQQHPTDTLTADLRGGGTREGDTLRIEVRAGPHGPVQSRAILRTPLVLRGNADSN